MKQTKKKSALVWIIPVAIIIVVCIGVFFWQKNNKKDTTVQTYTVREELFRNIIEISGNIKAAKQQNLQAAGEGITKSVSVKEGDRVSKNQILFSLDDTKEQFELANHDYQMSQERITGSPKKLALMQKQREVLLKNIENRTLSARFDGVIAQLTLASGDYVKAQDSFGYLIDRNYLKATVEIVETDAARLKLKQKVKLVFPTYPDLLVEGYVVSYPSVGRITTRGATVLDTEIRINNPPQEILPGYSFTGEIFAGEDEKVLIVESQAVGYENGQAFADRLENGKTIRVELTVAPYGKDCIKILSGLTAGDLVNSQVPVNQGMMGGVY